MGQSALRSIISTCPAPCKTVFPEWLTTPDSVLKTVSEDGGGNVTIAANGNINLVEAIVEVDAGSGDRTLSLNAPDTIINSVDFSFDTTSTSPQPPADIALQILAPSASITNSFFGSTTGSNVELQTGEALSFTSNRILMASDNDASDFSFVTQNNSLVQDNRIDLTSANGDGSNFSFTAGSGTRFQFNRFASNASSPLGMNQPTGANIDIQVQNNSLLNDNSINSASDSGGGEVNFSLGESSSFSSNTITSNSQLGGADITISTAGNVLFSENTITTESSSGGGTIELNTGNNFLFENSAIATTSESGGADVLIRTGESTFFSGGSITTNSNTDGGDIGLSTSEALSLSSTSITTNAQSGGGNLTIAAPGSIIMAGQSLLQTQGTTSLFTLTADRLEATPDDGNDIIAANPSSERFQLSLSESPEPEFSFVTLPDAANSINEISSIIFPAPVPPQSAPPQPAPPQPAPPQVTPPTPVQPVPQVPEATAPTPTATTPTPIPPTATTPATTTPTPATTPATTSAPIQDSLIPKPLLKISLIIPSSQAEELEAFSVSQVGNNNPSGDRIGPQCGRANRSQQRSRFTNQGRGGVAPTPGSLGNQEILVDLGVLSLAEESRGESLSLFPMNLPTSLTPMHRAVVMPREAGRWRKTLTGEIHLAGNAAMKAIAHTSCNV